MVADRVYEGNVDLTFLPEADYHFQNQEFTYEGLVELSLIPSSNTIYEKRYEGYVELTLTPSAEVRGSAVPIFDTIDLKLHKKFIELEV